MASLASFENLGMPIEPVFDASCQLHDGTLLVSQGLSRKVGESEQRGVSRTLTGGPSTTRIGFRASEGQLKVRRLIASAVVDSCLNYIVESCVLRA